MNSFGGNSPTIHVFITITRKTLHELDAYPFRMIFAGVVGGEYLCKCISIWIFGDDLEVIADLDVQALNIHHNVQNNKSTS